MPVVGFIDSAGQKVTFEDVRAGKGDFRTGTGECIPLPILSMLTRQYRDTGAHYGSENAVSVTQLIAPVQQQRLMERWNLYAEPLDNLWAAYGTLVHLMLEMGADEKPNPDTVKAELKLIHEHNGTEIGGTMDLLEWEGADGWAGTDYKVTSAYGIKGIIKDGLYAAKEDYYWQAQLYAQLCRWHDINVTSWKLCAICRDYNARQHGVHFGPVEVVQVPLLEESRVLNYINQRVIEWQASGLCDDAGLPNCTDKETWGGRRCASYCAAAPRCHQFDQTLGMTEDDH